MADPLTAPQLPPPPPPPVPPVDRPAPWRSILTYAAVAVAAFIVGIAIGAASGGDTETRTVERSDESLRERRDQLDARAAELEDREAALEAREAELAAADEAAEGEDPAPKPTEPAPPGDGYTAGQYHFTDVQVRNDGLGDFEIVARVTNTGESVESVAWLATLFNEGTVVGVLDGFVDGFESGETVTVQFFGVDDHGDWDSVEFQVEYEF